MGTVLVKTGDVLRVTVTPPAVIPQLLAPVPLVGTSSTLLVEGSPACLVGDELPPALRGPLAYTAPPFVTPGTGQLTLRLLPENQTLLTKNGKAILVKGTPFIATFQVQTPAQQPTPAGPIPDPLMVKTFTAEFDSTTGAITAG